MKVAVVYNRDRTGVINVMKVQNQETYDPKTVEAVAAALEAGGHNVRLIDGNMHVIERLREFMPRVMALDRPGMVFNMSYGIQGVSRYTHLPGMLEMLGVPYVGSNPQAHALALDKVIAKLLFQSQKVPTPRFWNFASADDKYDDITFPVIVKPKMEGMSLGIKVVRNEKELREAVGRIIAEFNQHVLVEEFIAGRELTVGLLGNGDVEALPVVELDLKGDAKRIRDDEGRNPLEKICPAPLTSGQTAQLQAIGRRAFIALGLNDYGRIDVRMDKDGNPYVLEINSMADLGRDGAYVFAAKHAGYSYEALINRVLNVAAARYFGEGAIEETAVHAASKTRGAQPQTFAGTVRSFIRSQSSTMEDTLNGFAELSDHSQILERVQKHLGLVGMERSDEVDSEATNLAYFSNHKRKKSQVLLVATVETPRHSQALSRSEDDRRLYGDKAIESLGGLTVMLSALRALRFANVLRDMRCGVLLSLGIDWPPEVWQPAFRRVAQQADCVLGLGASDSHGSLIQSRRGYSSFRLKVKFNFGKRKNPTSEIAANQFVRLLAGIQALASLNRGIAVGLIRADLVGDFDQLPQTLEAECAITFRGVAQAEQIDRRVRALAAKGAATGVEFNVEGGLQFPALPSSGANRALYRKVEKLARELHAKVSPATDGGPSVFNLVSGAASALDGFGPMSGEDGHGGRYILKYTLPERAALLALAAHHTLEAS